MTNLSVFNILKKVYGSTAIMFPEKPKADSITQVSGFEVKNTTYNDVNKNGTPIRKYTDKLLGKYEFMPVTIDDVEMPNALIIITGEKEIIETNVIDVGTVFEKAFTKPYDITVIATLVGDNGTYPETLFEQLTNLWKKDDIVTIKCAMTDYFLQTKDNGIITKISVLDNAGAENVEVIQFDIRSNIDFELEIN